MLLGFFGKEPSDREDTKLDVEIMVSIGLIKSPQFPGEQLQVQEQVEVRDHENPWREGKEADDGDFGVDDWQAYALADQQVEVGAADGDDDHVGAGRDKAQMEHTHLLRRAVRALQQLLGVRRIRSRRLFDCVGRWFHG
jgi:hypothetical protein